MSSGTRFADYQPFGKTITYAVTIARAPGKKGGYQNKYLFANKQLDNETDLQYFEKRYYDPRIGRFTTEDPVFWEVGLTERPSQYLTDPQSWNTYSYTRNNPINLVDPTGEIWDTVWDAINVAYDATKIVKNTVEIAYEGARNAYGTATNNQALVNDSQKGWNQDAKELSEGLIDAGTDAVAAMIPFVPAGGSKVARAVEKGKDLITKNGITIKGFTSHGIDRAIGGIERKGVSPSGVLDALKNPLKINDPVKDSLGRPSQRFIGKNGEIVINPETGKIISINPTSSKKSTTLSSKSGK